MSRSLVAFALVASVAAGCAPSFHGGALPNAPANATFADVDGVRIRYRSTGQGPAVVLIHGYGSSLDIWDRVAERLARSHRVIAVDLKGFGWSSRPSGDYSPAAQGTLVWKLLDRLGVRDAALVGHSWGTSVVLAMALASPARVRRIALYSAYVYEDQVPSFFRWARISGLGELLFRLYYRERMEDRVGLAFYDQSLVTQARVDRIDSEMSRPGTVAAALATARGQRYRAMERRYGSIDTPALLIWGVEDRVTPVEYGYRLVRDLPNAELQTYRHCGHAPMVEAFAPSTRALERFLTEPATTAAGAPKTDAPNTTDEPSIDDGSSGEAAK